MRTLSLLPILLSCLLGCQKPPKQLDPLTEQWRAICSGRNLRCEIEIDNRGQWYATADQKSAPHGHWFSFADSRDDAIREILRSLAFMPIRQDAREQEVITQ